MWLYFLLYVFLSYASADYAIARYLRTVFEEQIGLACFMLPDDAPAGSIWLDQIQAGVHECDELFSIATANSTGREWLAAEWSCFWLLKKRCTPLLVGVGSDQLWEPMRSKQAADLLNPSRSFPFLQQCAEMVGRGPDEALWQLAKAMSARIPELQAELEEQTLGQVAKRISERMVGGTEDINHADVALMVKYARIPELIDFVESSRASPVKQRQLAVALAVEGRLGEALRIANQIMNRAEARSVAIYVVRSMGRGLGPESEEWGFLFGIFDHLRPPQRRDVRDELIKHGIAPLGPWVESPKLEE